MPQSDNAAYVPLLRGIGAEVVLPRGTLLQPENIYYLVDGYCALIALTKNGKEYSFIYFRPGMLLNFIPAIFRSDSFNLLTQRRFISIDPVIVTKTRCVLLSVRSDEFMRRLESDLELHRLLARIEEIRQADVVIAVAGMEGALGSVLAGLVEAPLVAVPTSVGYGASFGGVAPLLAMLNSCAEGMSVVNIDNGFGAGVLACRMIRMMERRHPGRT